MCSLPAQPSTAVVGAAARPSSTSGLVSRAHGSRRFRIRRSRPPSHVLSARRRRRLLWDWTEPAPGAGRAQHACAVHLCAVPSFQPAARVTVGQAPVRALESTRNRFRAEQVWGAHGSSRLAIGWLRSWRPANDRGLTRDCPMWRRPPCEEGT